MHFKFGKEFKKLSLLIEEKKEHIMNDNKLNEFEKRERINAILANKIYLPV